MPERTEVTRTQLREVLSVHGRSTAQEGVRGGRHAPDADRDEPLDAGLVRLDHLRGDVAPPLRRRPGTERRPGHLLAQPLADERDSARVDAHADVAGLHLDVLVPIVDLIEAGLPTDTPSGRV